VTIVCSADIISDSV